MKINSTSLSLYMTKKILNIIRFFFPILGISVVLVVFFLPTPPAYAAAPATAPPAAAINLSNPLSTENVSEVISLIIKIIFRFVGIAALCMFIWGGVLWFTAAGVESRIKKGSDAMMWAVIGMAVIFGAYVILNLIIKGITT